MSFPVKTPLNWEPTAFIILNGSSHPKYLVILWQKPDEKLQRLWSELKPLIPRFFENIVVKPSLLHGDLWSGNVGETDTEPSKIF